jgi:hypothetical protein
LEQEKKDQAREGKIIVILRPRRAIGLPRQLWRQPQDGAGGGNAVVLWNERIAIDKHHSERRINQNIGVAQVHYNETSCVNGFAGAGSCFSHRYHRAPVGIGKGLTAAVYVVELMNRLVVLNLGYQNRGLSLDL